MEPDPFRSSGLTCQSGPFKLLAQLAVLHQKARNILNRHVAQIDIFHEVFEHVARIGLAAGEDVQGDQPQVRVGMRGKMTFIEHHDASEARRRLWAEFVADLRDYLYEGWCEKILTIVNLVRLPCTVL